jgi:3-hydroxyisobutyrate dehydrogenase-like beta-hydroxyacid dehydrogenase
MGKAIGFIGLGNMGEHMAGRLLDAGHQLTVFDIRDDAMAALVERGATAAASPALVASLVETVITSLPTPDIVKDVALGADGVISAGPGSKIKTLVDLSTIGSRVAREIAAELAARDITFVDSPVSGGVAGARNGTLAVMVACPDRHYSDLADMLQPLGNVFHVGAEPGLGQTMKLANNLLSAAALSITSEAMVMGVKAGLDPAVMLDVINAGSGRNTATADKFPKAILNRAFDRGFANGLMNKDVELFLAEAAALDTPADVASAVGRSWQTACRELGAEADFTTIVQCAEKRAGVEVKSN